MFAKNSRKLAAENLLDRTSQLDRIERDIRQRFAARSQRLASTDAVRRDLVQERLAWLLARVSAKRHVAAAQLALVSA